MANSSVPALKANLVAQLQGRPGLSGIQVTNGPPLPAPQREFIWVGNAEGEQVIAGFSGPRHEEYGVEVVISVIREGIDTPAADTRCFALFAELEQQLRTDSTVNGAVSFAEVGAFRLSERASADGMNRESELVVTVNCKHNWI